MSKTGSGRISQQEAATLASLGGVETSAENLAAIGPQIQRLHEAASRLAELNLEGVEPAFVLRMVKE